MKAESVHLVRVTTDDRECRIWAAATAREEAVDYVLGHIPEGWSACLLEDPGHEAGRNSGNTLPPAVATESLTWLI